MKKLTFILLCFLSLSAFTSTKNSTNPQKTESIFESKTGVKINFILKRREKIDECVNFSGSWALKQDLSNIPEKLRPEFLEIDQIGCEYLFVSDSHSNFLGYFKLGHHVVSFPTEDHSQGLHTAAKWENPYQMTGTMTMPHLTGYMIRWNWTLSQVPNESDAIKVEINTYSLDFNFESDHHQFIGIFNKTTK